MASRRPLALLALLAALLVVAAPGDAEAQCALCRRSLEEGGGDGLITGFYVSTMLIFSTPFLLIGNWL